MVKETLHETVLHETGVLNAAKDVPKEDHRESIATKLEETDIAAQERIPTTAKEDVEASAAWEARGIAEPAPCQDKKEEDDQIATVLPKSEAKEQKSEVLKGEVNKLEAEVGELKIEIAENELDIKTNSVVKEALTDERGISKGEPNTVKTKRDVGENGPVDKEAGTLVKDASANVQSQLSKEEINSETILEIEAREISKESSLKIGDKQAPAEIKINYGDMDPRISLLKKLAPSANIDEFKSMISTAAQLEQDSRASSTTQSFHPVGNVPSNVTEKVNSPVNTLSDNSASIIKERDGERKSEVIEGRSAEKAESGQSEPVEPEKETEQKHGGENVNSTECSTVLEIAVEKPKSTDVQEDRSASKQNEDIQLDAGVAIEDASNIVCSTKKASGLQSDAKSGSVSPEMQISKETDSKNVTANEPIVEKFPEEVQSGKLSSILLRRREECNELFTERKETEQHSKIMSSDKEQECISPNESSKNIALNDPMETESETLDEDVNCKNVNAISEPPASKPFAEQSKDPKNPEEVKALDLHVVEHLKESFKPEIVLRDKFLTASELIKEKDDKVTLPTKTTISTNSSGVAGIAQEKKLDTGAGLRDLKSTKIEEGQLILKDQANQNESDDAQNLVPTKKQAAEEAKLEEMEGEQVEPVTVQSAIEIPKEIAMGLAQTGVLERTKKLPSKKLAVMKPAEPKIEPQDTQNCEVEVDSESKTTANYLTEDSKTKKSILKEKISFEEISRQTDDRSESLEDEKMKEGKPPSVNRNLDNEKVPLEKLREDSLEPKHPEKQIASTSELLKKDTELVCAEETAIVQSELPATEAKTFSGATMKGLESKDSGLRQTTELVMSSLMEEELEPQSSPRAEMSSEMWKDGLVVIGKKAKLHMIQNEVTVDGKTPAPDKTELKDDKPTKQKDVGVGKEAKMAAEQVEDGKIEPEEHFLANDDKSSSKEKELWLANTWREFHKDKSLSEDSVSNGVDFVEKPAQKLLAPGTGADSPGLTTDAQNISENKPAESKIGETEKSKTETFISKFKTPRNTVNETELLGKEVEIKRIKNDLQIAKEAAEQAKVCSSTVRPLEDAGEKLTRQTLVPVMGSEVEMEESRERSSKNLAKNSEKRSNFKTAREMQPSVTVTEPTKFVGENSVGINLDFTKDHDNFETQSSKDLGNSKSVVIRKNIDKVIKTEALIGEVIPPTNKMQGNNEFVELKHRDVATDDKLTETQLKVTRTSAQITDKTQITLKPIETRVKSATESELKFTTKAQPKVLERGTTFNSSKEQVANEEGAVPTHKIASEDSQVIRKIDIIRNSTMLSKSKEICDVENPQMSVKAGELETVGTSASKKNLVEDPIMKNEDAWVEVKTKGVTETALETKVMMKHHELPDSKCNSEMDGELKERKVASRIEYRHSNLGLDVTEGIFKPNEKVEPKAKAKILWKRDLESLGEGEKTVAKRRRITYQNEPHVISSSLTAEQISDAIELNPALQNASEVPSKQSPHEKENEESSTKNLAAGIQRKQTVKSGELMPMIEKVQIKDQPKSGYHTKNEETALKNTAQSVITIFENIDRGDSKSKLMFRDTGDEKKMKDILVTKLVSKAKGTAIGPMRSAIERLRSEIEMAKTQIQLAKEAIESSKKILVDHKSRRRFTIFDPKPAPTAVPKSQELSLTKEVSSLGTESWKAVDEGQPLAPDIQKVKARKRGNDAVDDDQKTFIHLRTVDRVPPSESLGDIESPFCLREEIPENPQVNLNIPSDTKIDVSEQAPKKLKPTSTNIENRSTTIKCSKTVARTSGLTELAVVGNKRSLNTEGSKEDCLNRKRRRRSRQGGEMWKNIETRTIYVSGLPTKEDDWGLEKFVDYFEKIGLVSRDSISNKPRAELCFDRETGKLNGEGNLTFVHEASVNMAVDLEDGATLQGKQIKVAFSKLYQDRTLARKQHFMNKGSICILLNVFQAAKALDDHKGKDHFYSSLQSKIWTEVSKIVVPKTVAIFRGSPVGAAAVNFYEHEDASKFVSRATKSSFFQHGVKCKFWDGITNYKVMFDADRSRLVTG